MKRRELLSLASAALTAASVGTSFSAIPIRRLGLVVHSYSHRWRGQYSSVKNPPFQDALDVFDHIRELNAGSLQIGVEGWTMDFARQIRATCESYHMTVEGSIRLPRTEPDVARFERELRIAKEAGVSIFRTALGGRRYESFHSRADFESWKASAVRSVQLAEAIARKLRVAVAVENHKDFELDELTALLRQTASAHVGACVDTGNSLALLEDPLVVVEALAPYALTVHLKDIAVRPVDDGFEMAEVPLGQGALPLEAMLRLLRAAPGQPQFQLEMITRDSLRIPCLKPPYWASFPDKAGLDVVKTLDWVRAHASSSLAKVEGLSKEGALVVEEDNIIRSLNAAGERFGFSQPERLKLSTERSRS